MVYDCEFTLNIKGKNDNEGELELLDVNNHDLEADFEHKNKIKDKELYQKVRGNQKEIDNYIKELFKQFWETQKN